MRDIVIIGGGPGGIAAAIRARQFGSIVTLIEEMDLGGLCMNRGCIPTKTLLHTMRLYNDILRADEFGLKIEGVNIDLERISRKRKDLVDYLKMGTDYLLRSRGIEVIHGKASFLNPTSIVVNNQVIESRAFIIATGSCFKPPPIPGIDEKGVITSDEAIEIIDPPESIAILGGGPLEVEFAQYFRMIGSKVTIIHEGARILPLEDREIVNRMTHFLIENGIRIIKGVRVKNIRKEGDRLFIDYLSKMDEGGSMDAEIVLTMRRIPAVIGLGLERAGVKWDENGIPVDNELRTNVSNIYAIGDVTGGEMYSHRASAQGILAAENIHGMKKRFDPIYTPRAFYGIPEIGSVGLTEREAKARGLSFKVGLIPYSLNSMAMIYLKTEGIIKVICETKYGEVIGVHIIGPNASELICQAAIAMQMEATAEDIARVIFPHPSLSESFAEAARDALGKSLYIPSS